MIWGYPQFRNPLQYGVMVIKRFCVLSLKWLEHARTCWKISQFLRRDKCLSAFRALVDQIHSHLTTREHQKKVNHLSERWDLEWSWNNNLCAVDIWVWALKKVWLPTSSIHRDFFFSSRQPRRYDRRQDASHLNVVLMRTAIRLAADAWDFRRLVVICLGFAKKS